MAFNFFCVFTAQNIHFSMAHYECQTVAVDLKLLLTLASIEQETIDLSLRSDLCVTET